jgi:hypothetical protein
MEASTTLPSSFEPLLSKFLAGSARPKPIEPVKNTAPSFGALK